LDVKLKVVRGEETEVMVEAMAMEAAWDRAASAEPEEIILSEAEAVVRAGATISRSVFQRATF
jgi:hypothetical protein